MICGVKDGKLVPLTKVSFEGIDQKETEYLRPLLRKSIECGALEDVLPGLLVIAEEVNAWSDIDRRIDILAVDRDANLVVIEIKRTNHGGHAELQAIRYVALIEEMNFGHAVDALHAHLRAKVAGFEDATRDEAVDALQEFFNWDVIDESLFGREVRSVIVSAGFSAELLTSVAHLQKRGENITCLQVKQFRNSDPSDEILIAVNIVKTMFNAPKIAFSSATKKQTSRPGRRGPRAKYFVKSNGSLVATSLSKRDMVMTVVKAVVRAGHSPKEIAILVSDINARAYSMFEIIDGELSAREVRACIVSETSEDKAKRFCCESDADIFVHDGKTYALSNQWGKETEEVMESLLAKCKKANVEFGKVTDSGTPPADAGGQETIDK